MTMNIRLFGICRVYIESGEIPVPGGKPRELLAYLALHPRRLHPREALADVLFPDVDPCRARRNLTDALHRLRLSLGTPDADWLTATSEHIGLDVRELAVDVWDFEAACDDADTLALYEGDLAEDLDAVWLLGPRARLRELCLLRFEQACARLADAGQIAKALTLANHWASLDPLSEEAHCTAMRLYACLGRYAAALGHFDVLSRSLADELGVQPSPATQTLAELIRAEFEACAGRTTRPPAFVGRTQERRCVAELAERAQAGCGSVVLIEGEPGIGKSRLLEVLAETLSWRGFDVSWGRGRQAAALSSCSLLADARPQVLLLDDVHEADDSFWDAMQAIAACVGERRLLVLMAARGDELRRNERIWRAARRLDEHTGVVHINLTGLTEAECAYLARSISPSQSHVCDAGDVQAMHRHTQGNPLFVIESLRHPEHAIATFQGSLERRLGLLSTTAQRALQAAAVLGREFQHDVWQAMLDIDVLAVIDEVLASHIIHETERGYTFQHDLTHWHIYEAIEPAQVQVLHGRAGDALACERFELDIVADHFERAGRWSEALRFWRDAGDLATQAQAHANALSHYERAFKLVERVSPMDAANAARLALLCRRQRVLGMLARTDEWLADLQEIERLAPALGDSAALLAALEARLMLHGYGTNPAEMRATAQQALALVRSLGDEMAEARIDITLGTHMVNALGRADEALPLLHHARALAEAKGDDAVLVLAQCGVSLAQCFAGDCAAARDTALGALALIDARPSLAWARPNALQMLGSAAWFLADMPQAMQSLAEAFRLHAECGNAFAAGDVGVALALAYASCGQSVSALNVVDQLFALMSRLHLPAQADMTLWLHALAAECNILVGDVAGARRAARMIEPALIDAEAQPSQARLLAWQAIGRLRLAEGRNAEAEAVLTRAVHAFEQSTTIKVELALLHAIAAQRAGMHQAALASLHLAECRLKPEDGNSSTAAGTRGNDYRLVQPLLHFARFEVLGAFGELRLAHQAVQQQAASFTDPLQRTTFIERVALHHEIEARWQAHARPPQLTVHLARADAPLGRTLADDEHVIVVWTVDAGEDDVNLLEAHGMQALRRARLVRLIAEAQAQGAAPTHNDLAEALGVNVRTVARDLAATGVTGTRRNKAN